MSEINQKEYLKKYLSIGTDPGTKKKNKKRKKVLGDKVKIIDDDVDVSNSVNITEEELFAANEDAPQIVGIIDERPPELRIADYRQSDIWQPVGEITDENSRNADTKKFSMSLPSKRKNEKSSSKSDKMKRSPRTNIKTPKQESGNDVSPVSRERRSSDDYSPVRRSAKDSDLSPVRKSRIMSSDRRENDLSPPRKSRRKEDLNPPEKCEKIRPSSPRKQKTLKDNLLEGANRETTSSASREERKSRWNRNTSPEPKKMEKTLDGKTAGLQNAKDLALETEKFKQREINIFNNLSVEQTGANATTILRDRKTGRKRDLELEQEEQRRKEEEENKNKEKYSKWGKGLKQIEDMNEKIAEDLHEMSKPLARYADDEDLERFLKEQEREDDPMLAYIRKKKKKEMFVSGKPSKPIYEGEFMPNRFGIRPGYRWDGVDRSNGYEKRWFEVQNARKAEQEDVYKWSTDDM